MNIDIALPPILRVDDDSTDIFLFQRAITKAGVRHPLQVAENGADAIDYLSGRGPFEDRARYPLPCLILLDLNMPRVSGLDVLAWRRYQPCARQIPVVMLTSSSLPWDVSAAYESGANAYLEKPSDFDRLVEMVKAIKTFWLTHNTFAELGAELSEPALTLPRHQIDVATPNFQGI